MPNVTASMFAARSPVGIGRKSPAASPETLSLDGSESPEGLSKVVVADASDVAFKDKLLESFVSHSVGDGVAGVVGLWRLGSKDLLLGRSSSKET